MKDKKIENMNGTESMGEEGEENKRMELSYKKNYEFQTGKGSKGEIEIEAKIKDIDRIDLEEVLHEVAICTHNFYLSLGRKIVDDT